MFVNPFLSAVDKDRFGQEVRNSFSEVGIDSLPTTCLEGCDMCLLDCRRMSFIAVVNPRRGNQEGIVAPLPGYRFLFERRKGECRPVIVEAGS